MSVAMPHAAEADEPRLAPLLLASELRRIRLLLRRHVLFLRERTAAARAEFFDSDTAATIAAEIASAEEESERLRGALAAAERAAPLDVLAGTFGLHAVEREAVLLALAAEVEPSLEPMLAQANENAARTRP